jgi:hypothetical protein
MDGGGAANMQACLLMRTIAGEHAAQHSGGLDSLAFDRSNVEGEDSVHEVGINREV